MIIQQVFERYMKSTISDFLKTEKKANFPPENSVNLNLGNIANRTPLKFSEPRGCRETPTYMLKSDAKPSDVVKGLVSGQYSCRMSCQMVRQLCWYHAMFLTLSHHDYLGETKGAAVFNKLFTEIFPFVLRDFDIAAGVPFMSGMPFSVSRGSYSHVVLHPLVAFRTMNSSSAVDFSIGDSVLFNNFDDYINIANQACAVNYKKANRSARRIAAIFAGKNESFQNTFYAFETLSDKNTKEDIAKYLTNDLNNNLLLIKHSDKRNSNELLNSSHFCESHTHEHFNIDLLAGLVNDTEKTLEQLKDFKDILSSQIIRIDKISDTSTFDMLKKMQNAFNDKGVAFLSEKKYAQAAESFTFAAANAVRAFECNNSISVARDTGIQLEALYGSLARSYELLDKPLLARYHFELAVNVAVSVGNKPTKESLEGLARTSEYFASKANQIRPSVKNK